MARLPVAIATVLLLVAAPAFAEETPAAPAFAPAAEPQDHGNEHEDSPGFSFVLVALGVLSVAWYRRLH